VWALSGCGKFAVSLSSGNAKRSSVVLRGDAPEVAQQECDGDAEEEAADVGEERDAAAVGLGAEEPEVRLEELVEEPEAEEEPGRDPHRHDHDQAQHGGVRIKHEVRAEDRSDRAARSEVRYA